MSSSAPEQSGWKPVRDDLLETYWHQRFYQATPVTTTVQFTAACGSWERGNSFLSSFPAPWGNYTLETTVRENIGLSNAVYQNKQRELQIERMEAQLKSQLTQHYQSMSAPHYYKREIPILININKPVEINKTLINPPENMALYADKRTFFNPTAQRALYFFFDPREGDSRLVIGADELQIWDQMNQNHNPNYSPALNTQEYLITIQVGHKAYSDAILFSFRARSQLSVADKTHRIASRYLIQSDYATPFEVIDEAAHVEMVFFENPIVNTTLSSLFLNPQDFQIILSAAEQTSHFTLLGNKTYLSLTLTPQQAIDHLHLAAQQVEIVHAQGINSGGRLTLDCQVKSFTVTLRGDLTVNSCGDTLSWQGKLADNTTDIRYTMLSNPTVATLYQIQLPSGTSAFSSLLQTLRRLLIHHSTQVYTSFSTLGLSGYWLVPRNSSALKQLHILGQLDQRNATLTLEETQSTLIGFTETWQPAFTVVEHYSTQANLATSLRLQGAESSLSTLKGQNPSIQLGLAYLATLPCETQGTVLLLESPQGHLEIHRFPNNEGQCITLNGIDYQVGPGSRLYAVGATEGRISGNRLLYDTDQRPVVIAFPMGLNASQLASVHGGVSVNGLQLEQLPKQTRLYFGNLSSPDIIPLHAFQDTLLLPAKLPEVLSSEPPHRHRHHHQRRQVLVAASSALRPTPWTNWLVPALQLVYRGYQPISTWLLSIGKSSPPKQESSPRQPEYNPITEPDEYTAGHFQGLLWLLDLGVRTWMKNKYPKSSQVILSPAWEEATAQAGEWVDDFYHSLQQAARASGVSLALATQPLETVTLVRQVAQQLYTGRSEEIEKLLKPVLHQVHQAIGNRATPKQADRFIAHCHHYRNQSVAIHRLQQQWASPPSGSGASPPLSPSRVTTAIPQLPVPLLSRVQDMT